MPNPRITLCFLNNTFTAAKLAGCSNWKCRLVTRSFVKSDFRCRVTENVVSYPPFDFVRFEFDLMIPNSSKYGLKWATLVSSPLVIVFSELTRVWFCVRRNRVEIYLIRNRFPLSRSSGFKSSCFGGTRFFSFLGREWCVEISRLLSRSLPIFGHKLCIRCRSFLLWSDLDANVSRGQH